MNRPFNVLKVTSMKKKKWILLILDLLLVLALGLGIYAFQKRADEKERSAVSQEELDRRYVKSVSYQGQDYPLKRNISTVLLIGTDNFIDDNKQNDIEAFYNQNLADFLVILVFDHTNKTITPFQICRDTMCEVPWLTVNGLVGGTEVMQITLAHTYGSGKEDSCVNTRNAVEKLLYGLTLDNYLAFSMETVPILNDLVGGVTVKLEDDVPALGPEYVRGAMITLKGKAALRFVRYRDMAVLDGNLARMAHHRLYLESFTEAARAAAAKDPDLATKGFKAVEKFLCTDLSVEQVSDMINEMIDYEIMPTVCPTGVYTEGEPFREFHMDDASLWECVSKAFCK